MVLQHATWDSDAAMLGISSRQLREALLLDGLMHFHREVENSHVMQYSDMSVTYAKNAVRHNGLPSWLHSCVTYGPAHISHVLSGARRQMSDAEQLHVLEQFQRVTVGDGHQKVSCRV